MEQEAALMRGEYRGPLHGIPIGIKDNIATAGIRTTVAPKCWANNVPTEDAEVVRRYNKPEQSSSAKKISRNSPPG